MTDNELVWFFDNGCGLLKNDDVDYEDMRIIRGCLERCAKDMADTVHKYITKKNCQKCTGSDKYGNCQVGCQCKYKIDRPFFVKR